MPDKRVVQMADFMGARSLVAALCGYFTALYRSIDSGKIYQGHVCYEAEVCLKLYAALHDHN
jgi:hypothetical protein